MLTKNEKNDYLYRVRYVDKTKTVNDKPVTKFQIKDKVRNTDNEYITYYVTVFDDIELKDGDNIRLLDFDNLTSSYYAPKKRIGFFISAVVEVVKDTKYRTDPDKPFVNPYE